MSRVRVQIMNQLDRKSHEYKAIKRYWKLIQQDSRKLSDKHFYRPEYQKRKDEICPFSSLAFFQPTTVDKKPSFIGLYFTNALISASMLAILACDSSLVSPTTAM
ncbi:IS1181 transposase [Streptococcus pneumoniae]|nr:IS1181 transposase [Streptococcus pneumoniae]CVZ30237.1 IS1181 transposase [Streptococcus pneumoniae]